LNVNYDKILEQENFGNSGATMLLCQIRENEILTANTGDSTAYICEDGEIRRLTRDVHRLSNSQEKRRLENMDAIVIENEIWPENYKEGQQPIIYNGWLAMDKQNVLKLTRTFGNFDFNGVTGKFFNI
jgi:serine/threonine protein phosphatase PrpC